MQLSIMEMAKLPTGTPVPAYVITTDDGSHVLIDTGLPVAPPEARTGEGLPMGVPEEMYTVIASRRWRWWRRGGRRGA